MGAPFITVADVVVDASARFADFVLRLNDLSGTPVRVGYFTGRRSASAGSTREPHSDSGAVTFAPGEIEQTVRVPLPHKIDEFCLDLCVPAGVGLLVRPSQSEKPGAIGAASLIVSDPAVDAAAGWTRFAVTLERPDAAVSGITGGTESDTTADGNGAPVPNASATLAAGEPVTAVKESVLDHAPTNLAERLGDSISADAKSAGLWGALGGETLIGGSGYDSAGDAAPAQNFNNGVRKEVYVFDSGVPELQNLVDAVGADQKIVILEAGSDGVLQLANALEGESNLDAIHVFSHGSVGSLSLGSAVLDQASLPGYSGPLAQIGSALTASGDLLLYGCNVAQGDVGQAFVEQLGAITGVDVAASIDRTGSVASGGNWILEAETGRTDPTRLAIEPTLFDGTLNLNDTVTVTLTGTIRYEDREYSSSGYIFGPNRLLPVRDALVELVDALGQPLGISTFTKADGTYSLSGEVLADNQYRVRTWAASHAGEVHHAVAGLPVAGSIYSVVSDLIDPLLVSSGVHTVDETITISEKAGAWNILDMMVVGYQFALSWMAEEGEKGLLGGLDAVWEPGVITGIPDYALVTNNISVGAEGDGSGNGQDWSFMDFVLLHEYGHYIQDAVSNSQVAGGDHQWWSVSDDGKIAWNEGFATFFAAVATVENPGTVSLVNTPPGHYVDVAGTNPIDVSLEWGSPSQTYKNEGAVAAVLWDIYDTTSDLSDELNSALGRNRIFSLVDVELDTLFGESFLDVDLSDFREEWNKRYPESAELVDRIIVRHAPDLLHDWSIGTPLNNVITGTLGDDTFVATTGFDTLSGSGGTDKLIFKQDLSYPLVRDANASVSYVINGVQLNQDSSFDQINSVLRTPITTYTISGPHGRTVTSGIELFEVNLIGTVTPDLIICQGGEHYDGAAGTDTFFANWGTTTTDINWVNDPAKMADVNGISIGGVERLLISTGTGNDTISNLASNTDDFILTQGGSDTVKAGSGRDVLDGGSGKDTLYGGANGDVFVLSSADAIDTIADYSSNEGDVIDVSPLVGAAYAGGAGQPLSALVKAVTDSTGAVSVQVDQDGSGSGDTWKTVATLNAQPSGTLINLKLNPQSNGADTTLLTQGSGGSWLIEPGPQEVLENAGSVTFTIRNPDSSTTQTVYISTTFDQGSPNNGDYAFWYEEERTFAAGVETLPVTIQINDNDDVPEGNETFGLIVQASRNLPVSKSLASSTFTIVEDDQVAAGGSFTANDDVVRIVPEPGSASYDALAGNDLVVLDFSAFSQGASMAGTFSSGTLQYVSAATNDNSHIVTVYNGENFTFLGGSGDDNASGADGTDILIGSSGSDYLAGGKGNDALSGGDGDDTLESGLGIDVLNGGAGDDTLRADVGGPDAIDGGPGNDFLRLNHSALTEDEVITAMAPAGASFTMADGTVVSGIERISLDTGAGNDAVTFVPGAAGLNYWYAGAGNDRAIVDFSAFSSDVFSDYVSPVRIGTQPVSGGGLQRFKYEFELGNVENYTFLGGSGNDELYGSAGDDVLSGGAGNDGLSGGTGTDTLLGGDGDDDLTVGPYDAGADIIDGGPGNDFLALNHEALTQDVVITATAPGGASFTLPDGTSVSGIERISLGTGAGNDQVTFVPGSAGQNSWNARGGNDRAIVDFSGFNSAVFGSQYSSWWRVSTQQGGFSYQIDLFNVENFTFLGGAGSDSLNGGAGNDVLSGGTGNDALNGGAGNDTIRYSGTATITGGSGTDTIVLSVAAIEAGNPAVTVTDFQAGSSGDRLDLVDVISRLQSFGMSGSDPFAAGWMRLSTAGGDTVVEVDLTGSGNGQQWQALAALQGVTANAVLASNFVQAVTPVVGGLNTPPTLTAPIAAKNVDEDSSFSFKLPANTFTDANTGDTLAYAATLASGSPLPAWLGFDATTQTFSGTPLNGDVGAIDVKVTATDTSGASASDVFVLTVLNTNDAPTVVQAIADRNATEGVAFSYVVPSGTFADVDAGDTLSYGAKLDDGSALPTWLTFNPATRGFSGTPGAGDSGNLDIRVTATDSGNASVSDVFTLAIANTNDPPTGAATAVLPDGTEDTKYPVSTVALVTGFTDADGDTLGVANLTADHGSVAYNGNGTWTITPTADFNGEVRLGYNVIDGNGGSVAATQRFSLAAVNDAPTGHPAAVLAAGTEDTQYSVSAEDLLAGFSDVDVGDVLSVANLTANHGTLANNNGTWTLTPDLNYNGPVALNYNVSDGHGGSVAATQTFTLNAVNDAPTVAQAIADQNATEGVAFSYVVPSGIFADVDAGDTLTHAAKLADGAALPTWLTFNPTTRGFSGTPGAGDSGNLDIRVTATDSGSASVSDVFALAIDDNPNDAPTGSATAKLVEGTEDTPYQIAAADLLAGFSDADGDALSVANLTSNHGSVAANGNGSWTITPAANYNGEVSLGYDVVDGNGGSAAATQRFTLAAVNDAPVAQAKSDVATEGGVLVNGSVLASDVDEGAVLTYSLSAAAPAGLTFRADGTYSLDPTVGAYNALKAGATQAVVATYRVSDGIAADTSTLTITVTGTNDVPVALNDTANTNRNTPVTVAVRANDSDPDGDQLTVTAVTQAANGTVSIDATTGNPTYTPNNAFSGTDSFTYTLGDGQGGTATATVAVTVAGGIYGDAQANTLNGTTGDDLIFGLGGDDTINARAGADAVDGGDGNDTITGGAGADTLVGGSGDDTFIAGGAELTGDAISGGPGSDTLALSSNTTLTGAFTFDTLETLDMNQRTLIVNTTQAVDLTNLKVLNAGTIQGSALNNTITGTAGNDTLNGLAGIDVLNGGDGNDTITGGADGDTLAGGGGDDTFIAGAGELTGDTIYGGAGNDTLSLRSNTTLTGALSFDTLETLDMGGFTLTVNGTQAMDLSSLNVLNAGTIQGSAVNNTVTGTAGNDTINGLAGDDVLSGAAGNDVINGGAGADTLRGGEGNDTFVVSGAQLNGDTISGGAGDDKLLLSSNTGISGAFTFDSIETLDMNGLTLSINSTQAVDLSSLSLLNGGLIEGNGSTNTITGTAGNDTINGLGASDVLSGAAGNDVIYGGAGADRISGGQGNDSLYGRLDAAADTTTDTFVWQLGDRGSPGAPAVDTVFGFSTRRAASGGDVLDVSGLLQGATGLSLSEYLQFQASGGDTELHISTDGDFAGGLFSAGAEDQTIRISSANLFTLYSVAANNNDALLSAMVAQGNLVT